MYVFDHDSNEKWMVYDEALPDSAPVMCREVRNRDDAAFLAAALNARDYATRAPVAGGLYFEPHRFAPVDDDRFSEACRSCGRNREDALHTLPHGQPHG